MHTKASGEVTGKSIKAHASISKLYSSTAGTVDHIKGGIGLDFYYFWYFDSCMLCETCLFIHLFFINHSISIF